MASTPLDHEYAEDVTTLREAQRVIADLRRQLARPQQLTYFADGEFTIFLDDEHSTMVYALFEQRRLVANQAADCELHDALAEAVSHWLDAHCAARKNDAKQPAQPARVLTY